MTEEMEMQAAIQHLDMDRMSNDILDAMKPLAVEDEFNNLGHELVKTLNSIKEIGNSSKFYGAVNLAACLCIDAAKSLEVHPKVMALSFSKLLMRFVDQFEEGVAKRLDE